jgi:hypothetical protein
MTRIVSTVDEGFLFDVPDFGQGLTSFNFEPTFPSEIVEATATRYAIAYGGGVVGVYEGRRLSYDTLTFDGVTLEVPDAGRLTRYVETWRPGERYDKTLDLPAGDFFTVSATADDSDNLALFEASLAGDDVIEMRGEGDDRIKGLGGDDEIRGGAGDDTLRGDDEGGGGDSGRDSVFGETGADRLGGGRFADVLRGGAEDDLLFGGRHGDTLAGGAGDNLHVGGHGGDLFNVKGGAKGTDVIADFGRGDDTLKWVGGAARFADLTESLIGGDLALSDGDRTVVFEGLGLGDVARGDVIFG